MICFLLHALISAEKSSTEIPDFCNESNTYDNRNSNINSNSDEDIICAIIYNVERFNNKHISRFPNLSYISLPDTKYVEKDSFINLSLDSLLIPKAKEVDLKAFRNTIFSNYLDISSIINVSRSNFKEQNFINVKATSAEIIGEKAFDYCRHLVSIDTPNLKSIGDYAFDSNYHLSRINLDKVETLGLRSFINCIKLVNISLPLVNEITRECFRGTTLLKNVWVPKATIIGFQAFIYSTVQNLYLPEVKEAQYDSFKSCRNLTTIVMPKVEILEYRNFYECQQLKEINFPMVRTIGSMVFYNCPISSFDFPCLEEITKYTFEKCSAVSYNLGLKNLDVIPILQCHSDIYEFRLPNVEVIPNNLIPMSYGFRILRFYLPKVKIVGIGAFYGAHWFMRLSWVTWLKSRMAGSMA